MNMLAVALAALEREEGIARLFDKADYPSIDACKKAALAYRNSFYSFKAQDRRRNQRKMNIDFSEYDVLGTEVDETPMGWRVLIAKISLNEGDFVDGKTGEPIDWTKYKKNAAQLAVLDAGLGSLKD